MQIFTVNIKHFLESIVRLLFYLENTFSEANYVKRAILSVEVIR